MILDFSVKGEVSFEMEQYVEKLVNEFEEHHGSVEVVGTPAASHLFDTP